MVCRGGAPRSKEDLPNSVHQVSHVAVSGTNHSPLILSLGILTTIVRGGENKERVLYSKMCGGRGGGIMPLFLYQFLI